MEQFKIIAFTHKSTELANLECFFIDENVRQQKLYDIKQAIGATELMYVTTCNRIEFLMVAEAVLDEAFQSRFFTALNSTWSAEDIQWNIQHALFYKGEQALEHILSVASSLDSLVVGEREIITQVRKAYEDCHKWQLTGDFLRLILKSTVKTAKEVFTHTKIAEKSVSVVFLAYQMLSNLAVKHDARFLIIGAGQTNSTMAKYLLKHGFTNFVVFNRTLVKADKLAKELNGRALPLSELTNYREGFDVLISCTGSAESIVTPVLYESLLNGDRAKKTLIDLALPNDIDEQIMTKFNTHLIKIESLKAIAQQNLNERECELVEASKILQTNIADFKDTLKHRRVELAMQQVPIKIKQIKHTAIHNVFAKELSNIDEQSKELLERILDYMEKKYIKEPMIMAKDILIGKN